MASTSRVPPADGLDQVLHAELVHGFTVPGTILIVTGWGEGQVREGGLRDHPAPATTAKGLRRKG